MQHTIAINTERCKGCFYCVSFCPVGKIVIADDMNKKGYQIVAVNDDVRCIGCNNCILMCTEGCIRLRTESEHAAAETVE